jgi:hypothetical protein
MPFTHHIPQSLKKENSMLTSVETSTLHHLEEIIEKNLQTFYEVGNALLQIRDDRLYRATHKTFEEYCKEKWDIGKSHAHRLMDAAKVIGSLSPNGEVPKTEAVVRPLAPLPPDQQREVWKEAVDTAPAGKVTAKHVQDVVEKMKEPKAPVVRLVSDAMSFATIAISQLERIRPDDPKRIEAFGKVSLWIEKNI